MIVYEKEANNCDMNRPNTEPTSLISHTDERSRIWHEQLRDLIFEVYSR
jgi:hypothetical protein